MIKVYAAIVNVSEKAKTFDQIEPDGCASSPIDDARQRHESMAILRMALA